MCAPFHSAFVTPPSPFHSHSSSLTQRLTTQLKHPGVIKVIEPLEETGGQMVFVTEPVFGSLADVLGGFRDVPSAQGESERVRERVKKSDRGGM